MGASITPTKANLIRSKNRLSFAEKGYHLLDQKRTVLIQEIMKLVEKSEAIEAQIASVFSEAYTALQQANISMGVYHVEHYAKSVKPEHSFDIRTRSIMGVDIPEVVLSEEESISTHYPMGFQENNPALDIAVEKFNKVKNLSYQLAEIEGIAYRLSLEIKKTRKSANALEKILIPELKETIKMIQENIEEKEREETFRIKKIKKIHQ